MGRGEIDKATGYLLALAQSRPGKTADRTAAGKALLPLPSTPERSR